jgi:hypothetical protein
MNSVILLIKAGMFFGSIGLAVWMWNFKKQKPTKSEKQPRNKKGQYVKAQEIAPVIVPTQTITKKSYLFVEIAPNCYRRVENGIVL